MAVKPPARPALHVVAGSTAANKPKHDTDEAVQFLLDHFNGKGRYLLTAIPPKGGGPITKLFMPGQEEAMRKWIDIRQGTQNLYYHGNSCRDGVTDRAKKTQIAEAVALWTDGDPRQGYDRDEERARILAALKGFDPLPTWIIDTGNGYQAGWLLDQRFGLNGAADIEQIESRNRWIRDQIDGGDRCQEVAHLLRLPGTVNLPNETKLKRGYTTQLARLVWGVWDRVYRLEDFPTGGGVSAARAVPVYAAGGELNLGDDAPAWLEGVIRTGDREDGRYHTSGSKDSDAMWAVINQLRRLGWDDRSIIALITDPQWPLSAHCLKRADPQAEAQRQIDKARHKEPLADLTKQGPVPLGYTDNNVFVVLLPERHVIQFLSPAKLSKLYELTALAPYPYWAHRYPGKDGVGINGPKAAAGVIAECHAVGPYNNTKVRGRGIWREGETIVVNLDRSEKHSAEGYIYPCFQPIVIDVAAVFDTKRALKLIQRFRWRNKRDAYLVLGWMAMAPICGVLAWRPHLWVHGLKETGKTTLFEALKACCAPLALTTLGDTTEAGIRQTMGPDSLPVIIDEAEKDANKLKAILRLARIASSADDPVYRGTPEGKAQRYCVQSTFALFGTRLQGMTPADESRFVTPELLKHDNDQNTAQLIQKELTWLRRQRGQWCSMMITRAHLLPEAAALFESIVPGERRHQQNMAALLGSAFVALEGRLPTADECEGWGEFFAETMQTHAEEQERDDAQECLDQLLAHVVRSVVLPDRTLREWLRIAHEPGEARTDLIVEARRIVKDYEMRIGSPRKAEEKDWLYLSNRSVRLKEVFEKTPWAEGGWSKTLRKLDGAGPTKKGMKFDTSDKGTTARATQIPLGYIVEAVTAQRGKCREIKGFR